MKMWLVDTNVILDIIGADSKYGKSSRRLITRYAQDGVLVINNKNDEFSAKRLRLENTLQAVFSF